MMKKLIILALCIGALAVSSCGSSDEPGNENGSNPRQAIEISRSQQDVVSAQNDFATRLFSHAVNEGNNVISPLSVSMAMSMAANGATGETYDEICGALGLEGADINEVNALHRTLVDRLPAADRLTRLSIANSIWIDNGFECRDGYSETVGGIFSASAESVDLDAPATVGLINRWVSDNTAGRIPAYLDSGFFDEADVMALVNALYFKSVWSEPFSRELAGNATFHNASGRDVKIDMMTSQACPAIAGEDGERVAALSYGNGAFVFTAILPPAGKGVTEYASEINGARIDKWMESLGGLSEQTAISARLVMPRFRTESDFELSAVLRSLGVCRAFTADAEFGKITDGRIKISKIFQKTVIEVDEKGAEASSATTVKPGYVTSVVPLAEEIVLNRPFIYTISESSTRAILFMGSVSELEGE